MKMTNKQKKLAETNVDLVDIIIRTQVKFSKNSYSMLYEELRSSGFMALCDAAINFDPAKDVKFRTYANRVVFNAILKEIKKHYRNEEHIFRTKFNVEEDQSMDCLMPSNDDNSINDFYRFENQELLQRLIRCARKKLSLKKEKKALDILELIIRGIEVKEIAKAMHTSPAQIRNYKSIAIKNIRQYNQIETPPTETAKEQKPAVGEQIRKKFTGSTHQLTFADLAAFGCVTFSL